MGRAAMRALLRGDDGEAESGAGAVLPLAANRVFRRHRQRARDCVAGSRFAGATEFSRCGTEGDAARSRHLSTKLCLRESCGSLETGLECGIELMKGRT